MERVYDFFSMLRGRGYRKLENVETTEDPDDEVSRTLLQAQQDRPYVRPFPKKEIIVGICMLVVGTTSIGLGALIRFGHWRNELPGTVDCIISTAHVAIMLHAILCNIYLINLGIAFG
jgi:hypothetical protein